jgi:hypothetical protein
MACSLFRPRTNHTCHQSRETVPSSGKALPVDEHPIREGGVVVGGPQVAQSRIQGAHRWSLYQPEVTT